MWPAWPHLKHRPSMLKAGNNSVVSAAYHARLKLLGLMVSTIDLTSGIRARGHGFDSCMLQMCAGAGEGIVGLNGPASCLWVGGHVGSSHVRNGVRLGWAESCSKWHEAKWAESQSRPVGAVLCTL
uniref:Uncharacterized protein n=1 Tax=Ananas comosus var. bracteatus TaxID=296719 RepID=A0A6V7NQW0_ANACO|nr:unnamed protein product [Ananas comosus var. bracteatus]